MKENDLPSTAHNPAELAGTVIGPYRLLEKIGEGGMGVVFMAEQSQPVRRRIALKIIKPGMDSKQVIARFEAERQALALMDHPNITRVLDAGTTKDMLPFFAMELVRGIPITDYCDLNKLTTNERLELFVVCCRAIQHAHTKGIIHRDIKPSNVLVTLHDGKPVPKIIDFGLARATHQQLTDKTLFTAFAQMVGTPIYMSPEQAEMSSLDIDTRSDIYSLGVMLYELLTGSTPLDRNRIKKAAYDEIRRIIREEDPTKPSTKISTIGETSTSVAMKRSTNVNKLRQRLRGELDWIVLKSLEKDRTRRYQTANDFAEDVQRHLDGAAVEACPPTWSYRATKFLQRYRAQVAISASFVGLLLASSIAAWLLYADARVARNTARSAEASALVAKSEVEVERDRAERNYRESEAARKNASEAREMLESQFGIVEVSHLAAQSRSIHTERPVLSTLLAIAAVELSQQSSGSLLPLAHEALLNASQNAFPGRILDNGDAAIDDVAIASDWLVTRGENGVALWDLTSRKPWLSPRILDQAGEAIKAFSLSGDGRWLVTSGTTLNRYDLSSRAPSSSPMIFKEQSNVTQTAQSFDGERLLTLENDGTVRHWSIRAENPMSRVLCFPGSETVDIEMSPDGRWIAVTQKPTSTSIVETFLWDFGTGGEVTGPLILKGHRKPKASADSRWLATLQGKSIFLWDLNTEAKERTPKVCDIPAANSKYWLSPDFRSLFASPVYTSRIYRYDLFADEPSSTRTLLQGNKVDVNCWHLTGDGKKMVTGDLGGMACIFDISSQDTTTPVLELKVNDAVRSIALDPSGRWLAASGTDGTARLWEINQNDEVVSNFVLNVPEDDVFTQTAISSTGRWIATTLTTNSLKLWDAESNESSPVTHVLQGTQTPFRSVAISADDRWLVAGSIDGLAHVWDLSQPDLPSSLRVLGNPLPISEAPPWAIGPEGRWLAISQADNSVRLWDLRASNATVPTHILENHNSGKLTFSPDGRWLVTSSSMRQPLSTVRVWDLTAESPNGYSKLLDFTGGASSLSIDGESRWLVVAGSNPNIFMWDLKAEDLPASRRIIPPPNTKSGPIWLARISPDARWLFTARFGRSADLWDLSEREPVRYALQTDHGVQSATISPDGRWLATGCPANAMLWDLTAPDPSKTARLLQGHRENVWSVAISADSRWLVTDASDGTIRRWSLDINWLLDHSREMAGRELTAAERDRYSIGLRPE